MSTEEPNPADAILNRLATELGIPDKRGRFSRLAERMNVSAQTIADWRRRKSVDHDAVIEVCRVEGIDLHRIFIPDAKPEPATGKIREMGQVTEADRAYLRDLAEKMLRALDRTEENDRENGDTGGENSSV